MARAVHESEWGGEDEVIDSLPLVSRHAISRQFDDAMRSWAERVEETPERASHWKVLKKYANSASAVSMAQKLKGRYGREPRIGGWEIHTRRVAEGELTAILVRYNPRLVEEKAREAWLAHKAAVQRKKDQRRGRTRVS